MTMRKIAILALCAITPAAFAAGSAKKLDPKIEGLTETYVAQSFVDDTPENLDRVLKRDDTQKLCSQYRNNPPQKQAAELIEREKKTIKYPDNGKLMGDWKAGEKWVNAGFAMRIGKIEPDPVAKQKGGNGGNCYACHSVSPKEVAAGNMGPSLTGYGALRGTSDDIVKYTYEKLYNAQAFVACSSMPRLGHNGVLKPEQLADITAYLLSPESPVNQK
jgi:sulfur-oxidizing protein SoxX